MTTPAQRLLLSLRDFIGDALSEPDITPTDIIEAIRDELKELQDYHKVQGKKIERLLGSIKTPEDVLTFRDSLSFDNVDQMDIAEDLDRAINFFNNGEDKIVSFGDDKIDFTSNKKSDNVWDNIDKDTKDRFRYMGDK